MKKFLTLLILLITVATVKAQSVGIKTNILYDATASANLGIEFGLSPKWTLDISGNYNGWDINDMKWKHWFVQPEVRLWIFRKFAGSFIAFHGIGGQFNFAHLPGGFKFLGCDFRNLNDHRFQGWGAGGGMGYGYACVISKHWNFEFEIAIGAVYANFKQISLYDNRMEEKGTQVYYGPTKLSLAFEYLF